MEEKESHEYPFQDGNGGFAMPSGLGETLDIGRDLGVTVTDYPTLGGQMEGEVPHVSITFDR